MRCVLVSSIGPLKASGAIGIGALVAWFTVARPPFASLAAAVAVAAVVATILVTTRITASLAAAVAFAATVVTGLIVLAVACLTIAVASLLTAGAAGASLAATVATTSSLATVVASLATVVTAAAIVVVPRAVASARAVGVVVVLAQLLAEPPMFVRFIWPPHQNVLVFCVLKIAVSDVAKLTEVHDSSPGFSLNYFKASTTSTTSGTTSKA